MKGGYGDAPISIGEHRANVSMNAADWSPREVILSVLRDMDNGIVEADAIVVVYRKMASKGIGDSAYVASSPDLQTTLGLLETAKFSMWQTAHG